MKFLILFAIVLLSQNIIICQELNVNVENIDIVRDEWGVPHIFAKTDIEVAYGFAWAQAEDDFKTLQEMLLPIRGLTGQVVGKEGAGIDILVHLIEANKIVDEKYQQSFSPYFKNYLKAYAEGINAYANHYPDEVLHKKLFPVDEYDIVKGFVLGLSIMSNTHKEIIKILDNKIGAVSLPEASGSNAFAISKNKTKDEKTYLAINSHQPLEGPYSWYEAHLVSEEGLNILGATFVGSPVISVGTNENLGWGHTLNYADFADIFQLEMNPDNKWQYKLDGNWETLEEFNTKARIRLLNFIKIGVKQKFYKSKYGVTFKTDNGFFALRFTANRAINSAEQWYKMNKATNYDEFMEALNMQAITCMNLVYADKDDHIYYLSNGLFPKRNPKYDWLGVVPGNTSETLWSDDFYPLDSLPQLLDPPSGYVYNCNHSPFICSHEKDNPNYEKVPIVTGYQPPTNLTNRAVRFYELINQYDKLDYEDFKTIKYDRTYSTPIQSYPKLESIFHLNPEQNPAISESIKLLNTWDREADEKSEAASIFILSVKYLRRKIKEPYKWRSDDYLTDELMKKAILYSQDYMAKHFGKSPVTLGELQRHSRGKVDLPVSGGPDVLAAMTTKKRKDGRIRASSGDSYIELVRYYKDGVEIETVNAFGSSAKSGSPHTTDQMELYVNRKLKPMTLDKGKVYKNAKQIYHPKK